MAIEIKAPNDYSEYMTPEYLRIFAGGSIEQGKASPWQSRLVTLFEKDEDVVILNPRREKWDASIQAVKTDKAFRVQVEWELTGQETSNVNFYYFDPATKSAVTLLEVGLFGCQLGNQCVRKSLVICPTGFWRKGNVDIVCERYGIPQFDTLEAAAKHVRAHMGIDR